MRTLACAGLVAFSLLALCASRAHAEVGATGYSVTLPGGTPRHHMTYGYPDDPELYAPILSELRRLQITFVPKGETYEVYYRGAKQAEWPVVHGREAVPETGEDPCVLVMGGDVYVPVGKIAKMFSLKLVTQQGGQDVALVPLPRPKVATKPVPAPEAAGELTLIGVDVEQVGDLVRVHVRANSPVRPEWTMVRSGSPVRIAIDFPNARWSDQVQLPPGVGEVQRLRTGMFHDDRARLVLEVPSTAVRITSAYVVKDGAVLSIGHGREARMATVDPEASAIVEALARRSRTQIAQRASRGGPLDGSQLIPTEPVDPANPLIPAIPDAPVIEHPGPLQVLPATSLSGKVICLDAGHGGHSLGAKGLDNLEKDLCLRMCRSFRQELEARGATVVMTRDSDDFVSLEDRCAIANTRHADLFISIHLNSSPVRNSGSGTETYWHTDHSSRLARALHRRVIGAFGGSDRGIRNRGFYVIKYTAMPSVLLEIGYINNSHDEQLLSQGGFHDRLAKSLVLGVLDFYGKDISSPE